MPLRNYREHSFNLFSQRIEIAGMSGPHNWGDDAERAQGLSTLKEQQRIDIVIGLHDEHNFTEFYETAGFVYHHIPITDFAAEPISPETYDKIFYLVKNAAAQGKKIAIHCGEGDGRTGTALASLKLRELLERQAQANDVFLLEAPTESALVQIDTSSGGSLTTSCTPFVKRAIEEVRAQRRADDESGVHSVETQNDVITLMNYEMHLRTLLINTQQFKIKLALLGLTVGQQEEIFNAVYGNVEDYALVDLFLLPSALFTEAHRYLILIALKSRFELLLDYQKEEIVIELFELIDLALPKEQYHIVLNIVTPHFRAILHDINQVLAFLERPLGDISREKRDFFLRTLHDRFSQLLNTGTKLFMVFDYDTDRLSSSQRTFILESISAQLGSTIKNGKEFLQLFSLSAEQLNTRQRRLIFNSVKSQLSVWIRDEVFMNALCSLSLSQLSEPQREFIKEDKGRLAISILEAKRTHGFYSPGPADKDSNSTQELLEEEAKNPIKG